jgi:hypothetical protein
LEGNWALLSGGAALVADGKRPCGGLADSKDPDDQPDQLPVLITIGAVELDDYILGFEA